MKFVCSVCGYVHEGDAAPERCPQCNVPADKFVEQTGTREWAAEHVVGVAQGVSEDIIRYIEAEAAPEIIHLTPVLLGWTSCSPVALKEEGLHRSTQLGQFFRWSKILSKIRHQLGSLPLIQQRQHLISISHCTFTSHNHIPNLDHLGRFGIGSIHSDLSTLACICSLCPGLEHADCPQIFINSYFFHS